MTSRQQLFLLLLDAHRLGSIALYSSWTNDASQVHLMIVHSVTSVGTAASACFRPITELLFSYTCFLACSQSFAANLGMGHGLPSSVWVVRANSITMHAFRRYRAGASGQSI